MISRVCRGDPLPAAEGRDPACGSEETRTVPVGAAPLSENVRWTQFLGTETDNMEERQGCSVSTNYLTP